MIFLCLQLRKFNFFDLNSDFDKGALVTALKGTTLSVATCGHNYYIFGDSEGNLVLLKKNLEYSIFKAYTISISHAEYIKHTSFLATVGESEAGINPHLKIWNLSTADKENTPKCVRITRLSPNQRAVKVTAIAAFEYATYLAVGFENGAAILFRGDISRERGSKQKSLKDSGSSRVTGFVFRQMNSTTYLFVTTSSSVISYDIGLKDKELKFQLDTAGCEIGCSSIVETMHEGLIVARNDALHMYTPDSKGQRYPMEGVKTLVQWSKTFLVIVSNESSAVNPMGAAHSEAFPAKKMQLVTIVDFHNNLVVYSGVMSEVAAILVDCGSFLMVTKDHKIHQLVEKDVKSKLDLLFNKNLYDVAIKMAKSQHYDEDGLIDIFRQYGDHLNNKGDRAGAIEQYIKTIGKLEPSYIIRKFMDSAHMEQLMAYLQALHRRGLATGDHTTLLLNCYIKLGKITDLKDFIMTKGSKVDFDIDIALKVVRGVNAEDALSLAKTHGRHAWVMRILLEDLKSYKEAIQYLSKLDFSEAAKCILDFGNILMEHSPAEVTAFLKEQFTILPEAQDIDADLPLFDIDGYGNRTPKPQDFLHLFLLKSEFLVDFLEHLVAARDGWNQQIYNALVEHLLVLWKREPEVSRAKTTHKLMVILQSTDAGYDREHVFLLCQMYDFTPGRIFLYEEKKMFQQVIQTHMEQKNYKAILAACRRFGDEDPSIWIHALWSATKNPDTPHHVLSEILAVIEKEKLQPPLMTLQALEEGSTLGQARRYLNAILQAEDEIVANERTLIEKYSGETERVRQHVDSVKNNTVIFRGSRCSICHRQLELPSVHFLCQHSYHFHCFQGYAENENECMVCTKSDKGMREMIKTQEANLDSGEKFHKQLNNADDGFTVIADYFGKGVFNKASVVSPPTTPRVSTTVPPKSSDRAVSLPPPVPVQEKPPTTMTVLPSPMLAIPGRREIDRPLAQSLTKTTPTQSTSYRRSPEPTVSQVASSYKNPFDGDGKNDDDDDDASNPFADEKSSATARGKNSSPMRSREPTVSQIASLHSNPFGDEDDETADSEGTQNPFLSDRADKSRNPFSDDDDEPDDDRNPFARD